MDNQAYFYSNIYIRGKFCQIVHEMGPPTDKVVVSTYVEDSVGIPKESCL